MSIPATCPSCGARAPIDHFLTEAKHKQAMRDALAIPPQLADIIMPYIGLFAPTSGRAMRADKLARIVRELKDLIVNGQVTKNGISFGAPHEAWRYGIETTLSARDSNNLELPLDDHNYMKTIVWRTARKAAGQQEHKDEEQKRQRGHASRSGQKDTEEFDQRKAEARRRDLTNEYVNLKQLHKAAPNDAHAKRIAEIKQELAAL